MTPPSSPHGSASPPRVVEVDALRGVSVALMIVVHTLAFFATAEAQTHGFAYVLMVLGKATAVFVVCMGFSAAVSRPRPLLARIARGARLVAWGYALNALKFLVPMYLLGGLPDALLVDLGLRPGEPGNAAFFLLLGDILHLAGLATCVIAVLQATAIRPWHAFVLAAAVGVAAPHLWGTHGSSPVTTYVADLVAGDRYTVFFPLFPWLAYALVGFGLGVQRRRHGDAAALHARWLCVGAAVALLALAASSVEVAAIGRAAWDGRDFYRTGPVAVAAVAGFTLMLFGLARPAFAALPEAARRVLVYLSTRVTRLYVISWVVICWSVASVGFAAHASSAVLVGLVAAVFASTIALERLVARLERAAARAWRRVAMRPCAAHRAILPRQI